MPLALYICAGITALLLIFEMAQIVAALGNIRETLDIIHRDLGPKENPVLLFNKSKPGKQREYWRDQNGFKHWRKTNNA